jgi:hypothetical protein
VSLLLTNPGKPRRSVSYPTLTIASYRRHSPDSVSKGGPDRPILRPARLTGASPTTTTWSRLASAPGIGHSPVATNQPSKITAKGSSLSTRPTATGTGLPLARMLPDLRPAPRSIASHRCNRRPVTLAVATHSLGVSPDMCVLGVYSWFHLQCVFGVLLGVGRGWQVVMILGPDHEPPVLSQSSGHWLMTPGDDNR